MPLLLIIHMHLIRLFPHYKATHPKLPQQQSYTNANPQCKQERYSQENERHIRERCEIMIKRINNYWMQQIDKERECANKLN